MKIIVTIQMIKISGMISGSFSHYFCHRVTQNQSSNLGRYGLPGSCLEAVLIVASRLLPGLPAQQSGLPTHRKMCFMVD